MRIQSLLNHKKKNHTVAPLQEQTFQCANQMLVSLSVSMFWDGVKWRFREGKIYTVFHG